MHEPKMQFQILHMDEQREKLIVGVIIGCTCGGGLTQPAVLEMDLLPVSEVLDGHEAKTPVPSGFTEILK